MTAEAELLRISEALVEAFRETHELARAGESGEPLRETLHYACDLFGLANETLAGDPGFAAERGSRSGLERWKETRDQGVGSEPPVRRLLRDMRSFDDVGEGVLSIFFRFFERTLRWTH